MPDYSPEATRAINSTEGDAQNVPVLLLQIDHKDLADPVRVVRDTEDLVHKGNTFFALNFDAHLPEQMEQGEPRANLQIDNIGRELVQWLEVSRGGEGATATFIQVRRTDPDTVEWSVVMDLDNIEIDTLLVNAEVKFDTLVNKPGIQVRYTADTAPGLF
jgi:hypothetical protein